MNNETKSTSRFCATPRGLTSALAIGLGVGLATKSWAVGIALALALGLAFSRRSNVEKSASPDRETK